jgi:hypothetical protein
MNESYKLKLRSPKWQKRKVEILIRDKFTCKCCENTERNLQVHHLEYLGNLDPWDYPDDMLITLCYICHESEQGRKIIEKSLLTTLKMRGFLSSDISRLSSAIDTNDLFKEYILNHIRKL